MNKDAILQELKRLKGENEILRLVCVDLHWTSRRYCDGRSTYATSMHNTHTKTLLALGVPLNPTADQRLFADDGMGAAYTGLTPEDLAAEQAYVHRHGGQGSEAPPHDAGGEL